MNIKLENGFELVTYSKDLIGVKKGNKTIVSYKHIIGAFRWIEENVQQGVKNRVGDVLFDFSKLDIDSCKKSFKTKNYSVSFDGKREFTISDLKSRNNKRWIYNKKSLIERVYHLEINRLEVSSIDELVDSIKELNIYYYIVLTGGVKC